MVGQFSAPAAAPHRGSPPARRVAAGAGEARLKVLRQQQDAAHRRHLAGIKQLAVVRRLLRPAPSPLELLRAPVGETSPAPAKPRRDAGLPQCGAGVEN